MKRAAKKEDQMKLVGTTLGHHREACTQDHASSTRQRQIVLWICVALLALLSAGAFYVLWGKVNGTLSSVECSRQSFCPVIVGFVVSGIK
jgi:hypothetical protein